MSATEATVRLFKGIGITVIGVFTAMGGLAMILFQQQWLGAIPILIGGYLVVRARPSIVDASRHNPFAPSYLLTGPGRISCERCSMPTMDEWRLFCVVCDWQPGDPTDAASARTAAIGISQREQELRAQLVKLYYRATKEDDDAFEKVWSDILQLEDELSSASMRRVRGRAHER